MRDWQHERDSMVQRQLMHRGVHDVRVLNAMRSVPREIFVPAEVRHLAYADQALPIACDQTISQPYIVALMSELLQTEPNHHVLEIGTGCGYQAAVLAQLVERVDTVEIVEPLYQEATERLAKLGYENVHTHLSDGFDGWPEGAPYQGILVAAAPPKIPQPLIDQLARGGRMIIPVGTHDQQLRIIERDAQGKVHEVEQIRVAFVPMTGKAQQSPGP